MYPTCNETFGHQGNYQSISKLTRYWLYCLLLCFRYCCLFLCQCAESLHWCWTTLLLNYSPSQVLTVCNLERRREHAQVNWSLKKGTSADNTRGAKSQLGYGPIQLHSYTATQLHSYTATHVAFWNSLNNIVKMIIQLFEPCMGWSRTQPSGI